MECACNRVGRHCACRNSLHLDPLRFATKKPRCEWLQVVPSPQYRSTRALTSILENQIDPTSTNSYIMCGIHTRKGFKGALRGARPTLGCLCNRTGPLWGSTCWTSNRADDMRRVTVRAALCRPKSEAINGPVLGARGRSPKIAFWAD